MAIDRHFQHAILFIFRVHLDMDGNIVPGTSRERSRRSIAPYMRSLGRMLHDIFECCALDFIQCIAIVFPATHLQWDVDVCDGSSTFLEDDAHRPAISRPVSTRCADTSNVHTGQLAALPPLEICRKEDLVPQCRFGCRETLWLRVKCDTACRSDVAAFIRDFEQIIAYIDLASTANLADHAPRRFFGRQGFQAQHIQCIDKIFF